MLDRPSLDIALAAGVLVGIASIMLLATVFVCAKTVRVNELRPAPTARRVSDPVDLTEQSKRAKARRTTTPTVIEGAFIVLMILAVVWITAWSLSEVLESTAGFSILEGPSSVLDRVADAMQVILMQETSTFGLHDTVKVPLVPILLIGAAALLRPLLQKETAVGRSLIAAIVIGGVLYAVHVGLALFLHNYWWAMMAAALALVAFTPRSKLI